MKRTILVCVLSVASTAALGAQEQNQANPYQGTSTPPPDDQILTSSAPEAKPAAGHRMAGQMAAQQAVPAQSNTASQPAPDAPVFNPQGSDDDGEVLPGMIKTSNTSGAPALSERASAYDPDGDIVHPRPLRRGEIGEGTVIRVRLLSRLTSMSSEKGETFRTRVASDVLQGGQVVIPAGAEIDGSVDQVSGGHPGGHGSLRLRPETVTLPDGARFRLHAQTTGTPGSHTRVGDEGGITPDSRVKRDGVEYGGAVGVGLVAGAVLGGAPGALAGGLIGAGVVTAHLLISHPQATLESGTVILFTLTEPLDMVPAGSTGN